MCDPNYHPNRFDASPFILIFISSVTVVILARFGIIYSFKIIFRKIPKKMLKMVFLKYKNLNKISKK